jgi:two-component system nitrogen regulation response regulator NtrX
LEEIRDGAFREDLYHRIAVIPIRVPPLRDRGDDVLLLARRFLERFSSGYRDRAPILQPSAEQILRAHPWPGNVRELRNLMERLAIMHDAVEVTADDVRGLLPPEEAEPAPAGESGGSASLSQQWKAKQQKEEKELLAETLREAGWNVTLAAEKLGIDRASLHRKMRRYGIARPGRRGGDAEGGTT